MGTTFSLDISVNEKGDSGKVWDLNSDIDGSLTFEDLSAFMKAQLIQITQDAVKEEQQNGFDEDPIYIVDGSKNKQLQEINPFGKVDVISRSDTASILLWAYGAIDQRSPILTGNYKKHNLVLYNGKFVADDVSSLNAWLESNPPFQDSDIIRILNSEPYARRLETLGVTVDRQRTRTVKSRLRKLSDLGIRVAAANGTYYLAYRSTLSQFKNNSKIRFGFITGSAIGLTEEAEIIKGTGKRRSFAKGRKGRIGRTYLYPTITISLNAAGLTDI